MSEATTLDKVIELLTQRSDPECVVTADNRLDDLGIDSIDLVYLLTTFERTSNAAFSDNDFELGRYETVSDLAKTIDTRVNG